MNQREVTIKDLMYTFGIKYGILGLGLFFREDLCTLVRNQISKNALAGLTFKDNVDTLTHLYCFLYVQCVHTGG